MKRSDQLPAQDFEAALHEISSNLDVRRLTFVLANVLVPALAMAMTDAMSGSEWPAAIAWVPRWIVPIAGWVLAVAGIVVSAVLARCHFGLVVNGSKLRCVRTGEVRPSGLNWLGVTTNFTALSALSAGAGLALALLAWVPAAVAGAGAAASIALLVLHLRLTHGRANRLCARLAPSWQQGEVPVELEERHARLSLEATTADISVVVTMAAALFAGTFNAMTNIGGIPSELRSAVPVARIRDGGLIALAAYTTLSLLLSGRMVVRLRLALAEHSAALARLRDEPDDAWTFRPQERTFLLFLLIVLLIGAAGTILGWALGGAAAGIASGSVLAGASAVRYPLRLGREKARMQRPAAAATGGDEGDRAAGVEAEPGVEDPDPSTAAPA